MFALQTGARADNRQFTNSGSLSREDGIPVHVCGTYAGRRAWRRGFPRLRRCGAAGPTQIRNYEALDYVRLWCHGPLC